MSAMQRVLLINPTITGKRHARFPLAVLSLAAPSEADTSRAFSTATSTATSSPPRYAPCGQARSTRSASPSWAARSWCRRSPCPAPSAPLRRRCRSSGAAPFPTVCPDAALNAPYVDYAVRGQGEETLAELLDALTAADTPTRCPEIRGLSWRRDGQVVHNPERVFSGASLAQMLPYDTLDNPRQYLHAHLPRHAHRRLPGGARLPLPLHVLRRRRDVPRQDGAADGRAPGAGPGLPAATRLGVDCHPVLRPQLLRPRSGHGAAARGAGAVRDAVVVLRALGCAREPVGALLGSWCGRAGCAWPISARSRPATGCCTTSARARAPIRHLRPSRRAAATA